MKDSMTATPLEFFLSPSEDKSRDESTIVKGENAKCKNSGNLNGSTADATKPKAEKEFTDKKANLLARQLFTGDEDKHSSFDRSSIEKDVSKIMNEEWKLQDSAE